MTGNAMINLQATSSNVRSSSSAASSPPAHSAEDAMAAGPFASLLAQQLDTAGLLVADTTESVTDEVQNQVADNGTQPDTPANILTAMALAEDRSQGIPGNAPESDAGETCALPPNTFRRVNISATPTGKSQQIGNVAETLVAPAAPAMLTGKPGPEINAIETAGSPAMAATPPNAHASNRMADTHLSINTPLGSSNWSNEFSQKISWVATQQNQVAELHLNPPNLGPLDVVLKITDNQATALFTSAQGAVRDAVETALPKLREMLAESGITLGNATVSDQPPRDRGAEGFLNRDSGTAARHGTPGNEADSSEITSVTTGVRSAQRHNGMVDTFA